MANDPNKSNKGPTNTLNDSDFTDIENIGRRASRHTAEDIAQRVRLAEARHKIATYEAGLQAGPPAAIAAMIGRQLAGERKVVNLLEPRIELRKDTQRQRFTDLTQSAIERNFQNSSINGQATEFSRSSAGQRLGLGMMNTPYEELEGRRQAMMNRIGALGQRASGIAESLYDDRGQQDPAVLAQLQNIYAQKNRFVNAVGGIEVAQRQQRALGLDPESRFERIAHGKNTAQSILDANSAAQSVQNKTGLGALSETDLKTREVAAANALVDAFKQLTDGSNKTTEKLKELEGQAEKAQKELKDINDVRKASGSGRGGRSGWDTATGIAGIIGMAGDAYKNIAVNQRMQEAANITGYASIENQKYSMYQAANQGDVASQLLLSQWGSGEEFGRSIKLRTGIGDAASGIGWGAAKMLGGKAAIAAGAAGTVGTAGIGAIPGAALATAGGAAVVSGGLDIATNISALARGTNTGQAYRAGVEADMEARRQIMAVSASQLQGLRDFGVGLGTAAIGMGGRGASFLDRTINKSNMEAMVNSRISPEQMAQMAQVGVQQIGSTFNESQIFGARGLERSGFGSINENMGRMASLAAAGSNNPQAGLGSVIEAAFTKSLDSSKALTNMVENTAMLASSGIGRMMGIDTTGASAQILAANVNANDPNQEYAVQRAMSAAQLMQSIGTDTGVNFAAMSATARISKMAGVGGDEAILLQQMTDQDLLSMQKMEPNELEDKLYDRGIAAQGRGKEVLDQTMRARTITKIQMGGAGLAQGIDADALAGKMMRGEKLTESEQLAFNRASSFAGFAGGSEGQRSAMSLLSPEPNVAAKGAAADALAGKGGSDQQKMLDDMRTQGFKQLSQAALEATANFKTAGDALRALGQLAKSVEAVGDSGGEGRFKTAAADSAKSFGESTMKFKGSVDDFSRAVGIMVRGSGLPTYNDPSYINRVQNLDQKVKAPGSN